MKIGVRARLTVCVISSVRGNNRADCETDRTVKKDSNSHEHEQLANDSEDPQKSSIHSDATLDLTRTSSATTGESELGCEFEC